MRLACAPWPTCLRGAAFCFAITININNLSISDAKVKIKAFDYLGPAYITYNDKNLKILSYSDDVQASSIELVDGLLYPVYVVPEGKNKMLFEDYLRGIK
mgnify:CR=1 FL=1